MLSKKKKMHYFFNYFNFNDKIVLNQDIVFLKFVIYYNFIFKKHYNNIKKIVYIHILKFQFYPLKYNYLLNLLKF